MARINGDVLDDFSFHDVDDALNELDETLKRWDQRLMVSDMSLAERYSYGEFYLVWKGRFIAGVPIDFTVVSRKFNAHVAAERKTSSEKSSSWDLKHRTWNMHTNPSMDASGSDRNKGVMFVQDVQLMQKPQRIIPSLVRLQPANEPVRLNGEVFQLRDGRFFELLMRGCDGKPIPEDDLFVVSFNKRADHLIQGRSGVMDNVPGDDVEIGWDTFMTKHANDVIAGTRVCIGDKFVWFGVHESLKNHLEIIKVAFGPLDF